MEWMATEKKCFLIYSWCSTDRTHTKYIRFKTTVLNTDEKKYLNFYLQLWVWQTFTVWVKSNWLLIGCTCQHIFPPDILGFCETGHNECEGKSEKQNNKMDFILGKFHKYKTKLVERINLALFLHFFLTPKPSGERLHWVHLTRLPLPDRKLSCCRPPPTFMDWEQLSLGLSPRA